MGRCHAQVDLGDQLISASELRHILLGTKPAVNVNNAQMEVLINHLDTDGSGQIGFEELDSALRKTRRIRAQLRRLDSPAVYAGMIQSGHNPRELFTEDRICGGKSSTKKQPKMLLAPKVPFGGSGNMKTSQALEATPPWAGPGGDKDVIQILAALKTYTRMNGIRALDFFRSPKLSKQTRSASRSAWMVACDYGTDDLLSIDEVAALLRTMRNTNPNLNAQKIVTAVSFGKQKVDVKELEKATRIASKVAPKLPNATAAMMAPGMSTVMSSPIRGGKSLRNQAPVMKFGRRMQVKGSRDMQSSDAFKIAKNRLGSYEGTGRFGQGIDSRYTEIKRAASDPTACASDPSWKLLHNWS
jgi:Ca2+-binding EF-hand superfamily protein